MLHVRFEGRSYDLETEKLNLGTSPRDRQILESLAQHFDVQVQKFQNYTVDRRPSGAVIVRPEAVYG